MADTSPLAQARREAVAEACGCLNDVDLPNVRSLARALKALIQSTSNHDDGYPNYARVAAIETLAKIEPYLPANIWGIRI
jgi:hypothetical protein